MKSQNSISLTAQSPSKALISVDSLNWGRALSVLGFLCLGLVFIFFLMVSVVFPVVPALGTLLLIFLLFRSPRVAAFGTVLVVCLFFSWMNGDKLISGDWAWYTYHNVLLKYMSFGDYLGGQFGVIRIKNSEPVYHFISFVTARLSGGNHVVLAWVVTAIVYVQSGAAIALFLGGSAKNAIQITAALFVALMVGITFTLTTQLVRQEVAAAFIVLGWAFFAKQWRFFAVVWFLLGLLSHNSAVVPFFTVAVALFLCTDHASLRTRRLLLLLPFFAMAGYLFVKYSGEGGYYTVGKSDGAVSWYVHVFDVLIFSAFSYYRKRLPELSKFSAVLAATWLLYIGFLVGAYVEPLPFLRMYFYIETMRMMMIAFVVLALFRARYYFWIVPLLMILSIVYVEARLMTSPFWYKGGVVGHLLRPFAFFY